jgi:hypothetical protein
MRASANPSAEADLAVELGDPLDLRQRVLVGVDDVVEEVDGVVRRPPQPRPVEGPPPPSTTNLATLMLPSTQDSKGRSGCSPQL